MIYTLRPYQQNAVDAVIDHFRKEKSPALIVLPTGAGKSLVIAELARVAKGRVLVLAHVKELVEQNFKKYQSFSSTTEDDIASDISLKGGLFSAGLNRKDINEKVIFGSIQSVARASTDFFQTFSLLVIDECHRISMEGETQYNQVIFKLREKNPEI